MTVPLYMDHHVPSAITIGLRRRSVDVLTAFEDGAAGSPDESILQRATELGRAVFTRDDDFLALADQWLRSAREFGGIIMRINWRSRLVEPFAIWS